MLLIKKQKKQQGNIELDIDKINKRLFIINQILICIVIGFISYIWSIM